MDWIKNFNGTIPTAILGPAVLILWLGGLWLVKNFTFYRLRKWAQSTKTQWDDVFVDVFVKSFSLPADLLIVSSGVLILTQVMELPEKYVGFAKIFLQGCVVLTGVLVIDRLLRLFITRSAQKGVLGEMSQGVVKGLLRGFVIGMGLLIFLDMLGISITPILASLGVGSLAVALALQDTLSNLFAGLYVSVDRPIRTGDYVRLESGQEGYITDIGWRNTRIRTLSDTTVVLPNSKLVGSIITNYYQPSKEVTITLDAGVHYESDLEKVEKVIADVGAEVMKTVPGAVPEFKPFIRYHTFGDRSINFTIVLRAKEFTEGYLIKHEFIKKLTRRFRKEKIVMPYVNLIPVIPAEERDEDKKPVNV